MGLGSATPWTDLGKIQTHHWPYTTLTNGLEPPPLGFTIPLPAPHGTVTYDLSFAGPRTSDSAAPNLLQLNQGANGRPATIIPTIYSASFHPLTAVVHTNNAGPFRAYLGDRPVEPVILPIALQAPAIDMRSFFEPESLEHQKFEVLFCDISCGRATSALLTNLEQAETRSISNPEAIAKIRILRALANLRQGNALAAIGLLANNNPLNVNQNPTALLDLFDKAFVETRVLASLILAECHLAQGAFYQTGLRETSFNRAWTILTDPALQENLGKINATLTPHVAQMLAEYVRHFDRFDYKEKAFLLATTTCLVFPETQAVANLLDLDKSYIKWALENKDPSLWERFGAFLTQALRGHNDTNAQFLITTMLGTFVGMISATLLGADASNFAQMLPAAGAGAAGTFELVKLIKGALSPEAAEAFLSGKGADNNKNYGLVELAKLASVFVVFGGPLLFLGMAPEAIATPIGNGSLSGSVNGLGAPTAGVFSSVAGNLDHLTRMVSAFGLKDGGLAFINHLRRNSTMLDPLIKLPNMVATVLAGAFNTTPDGVYAQLAYYLQTGGFKAWASFLPVYYIGMATLFKNWKPIAHYVTAAAKKALPASQYQELIKGIKAIEDMSPKIEAIIEIAKEISLNPDADLKIIIKRLHPLLVELLQDPSFKEKHLNNYAFCALFFLLIPSIIVVTMAALGQTAVKSALLIGVLSAFVLRTQFQNAGRLSIKEVDWQQMIRCLLYDHLNIMAAMYVLPNMVAKDVTGLMLTHFGVDWAMISVGVTIQTLVTGFGFWRMLYSKVGKSPVQGNLGNMGSFFIGPNEWGGVLWRLVFKEAGVGYQVTLSLNEADGTPDQLKKVIDRLQDAFPHMKMTLNANGSLDIVVLEIAKIPDAALEAANQSRALLVNRAAELYQEAINAQATGTSKAFWKSCFQDLPLGEQLLRVTELCFSPEVPGIYFPTRPTRAMYKDVILAGLMSDKVTPEQVEGFLARWLAIYTDDDENRPRLRDEVGLDMLKIIWMARNGPHGHLIKSFLKQQAAWLAPNYGPIADIRKLEAGFAKFNDRVYHPKTPAAFGKANSGTAQDDEFKADCATLDTILKSVFMVATNPVPDLTGERRKICEATLRSVEQLPTWLRNYCLGRIRDQYPQILKTDERDILERWTEAIQLRPWDYKPTKPLKGTAQHVARALSYFSATEVWRRAKAIKREILGEKFPQLHNPERLTSSDKNLDILEEFFTRNGFLWKLYGLFFGDNLFENLSMFLASYAVTQKKEVAFQRRPNPVFLYKTVYRDLLMNPKTNIKTLTSFLAVIQEMAKMSQNRHYHAAVANLLTLIELAQNGPHHAAIETFKNGGEFVIEKGTSEKSRVAITFERNAWAFGHYGVPDLASHPQVQAGQMVAKKPFKQLLRMSEGTHDGVWRRPLRPDDKPRSILERLREIRNTPWRQGALPGASTKQSTATTAASGNPLTSVHANAIELTWPVEQPANTSLSMDRNALPVFAKVVPAIPDEFLRAPAPAIPHFFGWDPAVIQDPASKRIWSELPGNGLWPVTPLSFGQDQGKQEQQEN